MSSSTDKSSGSQQDAAEENQSCPSTCKQTEDTCTDVTQKDQDPHAAATSNGASNSALGERLAPLVQGILADLATRVTSVLLNTDNSALVRLLDDQKLLKTRVKDLALAELQDSTTDKKEEQKLGESLFPHIQRKFPALASKFTSFLRETVRPDELASFGDPLRNRLEEAALMFVAAALGKLKSIHLLLPYIQFKHAHQAARIASFFLDEDLKLTRMLVDKESIAAMIEEARLQVSSAAKPLSNEKPKEIGEDVEQLGNEIYLVVQKMHPELAGKLTGMLLEINLDELQLLVKDYNLLKDKIEFAYASYRAHVLGSVKSVLFDSLAPLVKDAYPNQRGSVLSLLIERDNADILHILEHPETLRKKVEEAKIEKYASEATLPATKRCRLKKLKDIQK